MHPMKFTEEELAALTDEERAGLEDDSVIDEGMEPDTDDEDDADAGTEPGKTDEDPDKKPEDDDKAEPAADDDPAKEPEKDPATAAAEDDDDDQQPPAPAESRSVLPNYELPSDIEQRMEDIKTRRRELAEKFDDGEITAAELREQDDALLDERDKLKEIVLKAQISRESAIHTWSKATVPNWLSEHKEYKRGTPLYNQLNDEVKRLQAEGGDPFDPAILDRAHENIQAAARAVLGLPPTAKGGATPEKTAKRPDMPPSLHNVPATDQTDLGDGGEFAYLDRLADKDPLAYENALAKLQASSPEKYEQYMAQ